MTRALKKLKLSETLLIDHLTIHLSLWQSSPAGDGPRGCKEQSESLSGARITPTNPSLLVLPAEICCQQKAAKGIGLDLSDDGCSSAMRGCRLMESGKRNKFRACIGDHACSSRK
jgi:hypothetical protein